METYPNLDDWLERNRELFAPTVRPILDLGCGPGIDLATLSSMGRHVVGLELRQRQLVSARIAVPRAALVRGTIERPLPFRSAAFDAAVASLSLHYFPWDVTVAAFREVRRVLNAGAPFLFRVNATDDFNFGAGQGELIEPDFFRTSLSQPESSKRFFDDSSVKEVLRGAFAIRLLQHGWISRYGMEKRVWECLAIAE